MMMATMTVYLSGCLCLLLLSVVFKFLHKFWWTPISIQWKMRSQGIKGPSYKFMHGNFKEIISMRNGIKMKSGELSHDILPIIQPHIYSWLKLFGRNFILWYGPAALLYVTEPELIREILNDKDGAYPKRKLAYISKKLFGDGLATAQGRKWLKQRKLANHTFRAETLKNMIPSMMASVEMMLERWRQYEGKEIDVFQEFKVLTSEIISRTAFGSSYLEGKNTFNMLTTMVTIILRSSFRIRIPVLDKLVRTPDDIESDKLQQDIKDSIIKMIKKREKDVHRGELESYGGDFLGVLIKANHSVDENQKISIDDVVDECKTFYFAGHEATASLLSWTILLLATHTHWQDRARKEVLELFGQQNPYPDSISRLKITSMIINESLRLYSPATDLIRETKKEIKLGRFMVPANIDITISVPAVHRDPQIWGEDAHLFRPERFAEGVAKATNNNMAAFLPFGLGPRTCAGLNFATIETKLTLSMILQRYKFTLSPTYVHSPVQLITVQPQHGLKVLLRAL